MKSPRTHAVGIALAAITVGLAQSAGSDVEVAQLGPSRDNTLVESDDGSLSLALSQFVFAGRTGNHAGAEKLRRGLLEFDVASAIPRGATILSVELHVLCVMTNTGELSVQLRRSLQAWGEGTSDGFGGAGAPATPGDATWLHTFWPDQFWSMPGGSFAEEPSAVTTIGFAGTYTWTTTPGLVADVQAWLDDPASNLGWGIIGNEVIPQSVKALASQDYVVEADRPRLVIQYLAPAAITGDLDGDGVVDGADLGLLLGAWGPCPLGGALIPCEADLTGDGTVDGADLGVLLGGWSV